MTWPLLGVVWFSLQTVFNSMCGYETLGIEESLIKGRIYINGCLNKIVLWGKQNLMLVGGISISLLFIEVRHAFKHFLFLHVYLEIHRNGISQT